MTPLQQHLAKRPEMPRPFDPYTAEAMAWQRAMQWWVDTKHLLELSEALGRPLKPQKLRPFLSSPAVKPNTHPCVACGCEIERTKKLCFSCATSRDDERTRSKNAAATKRLALIREGLRQRKDAA